MITDRWISFLTGLARSGDFKVVPTRFSNQLAAADYVRASGKTAFERPSLDMLRAEE